MLCKCGKPGFPQYYGSCEDCFVAAHLTASNYYREEEKPLDQMTDEEKLNLPISDLEMPVRITERLYGLGFKTLRDLVKKTATELLRIGDFGEKSLYEVAKGLQIFGFKLRNDS